MPQIDLDALLSDEDDAGDNLVKNLRAALKAVRKERDTALEQVATESAANRAGALKSALESHGAKAGLAKFYPADAGTDEASVKAWLAEDGELFGWNPDAQPSAQEETSAPSPDAARAAAARAVAAATPAATPPTDITSRVESLGRGTHAGSDEATKAKEALADLTRLMAGRVAGGDI